MQTTTTAALRALVDPRVAASTSVDSLPNVKAVALRTLQPGLAQPMLPTLVDQPPEDDNWIHEIGYDGYRMLIAVDFGRLRRLWG